MGRQGTWGPQGQAEGQGKGPQAPNLRTSLSTNESQQLSPKPWSCGTTLPSRNDQHNLSQAQMQPQHWDRNCHQWPRVPQLSERLYQGYGHLHDHLEMFQGLEMNLSGAGGFNVYKELGAESCLLCKCKIPVHDMAATTAATAVSTPNGLQGLPPLSTFLPLGSPPGRITPEPTSVEGFCTNVAVRSRGRGEGGCSPHGKAGVTIALVGEDPAASSLAGLTSSSL